METETSSPYGSLRASVSGACTRLQNSYLNSANHSASGQAKAKLAQLRKANGLRLEQNPLALEKVLLTLEPPLDPTALGKGDAPSPSEKAAAAAMTLFAAHMQSAKVPAHQQNQSFARACGRLQSLGLSKSIEKRIDAMLLASEHNARMVHIRSIVSLMRANQISFDYGELARDLRTLMDPKKRSGVQLRWGRDYSSGYFHATNRQSTEN